MSTRPDGYLENNATWDTDVSFTTSSGALTADGYIEWAATTPASNPGIKYSAFIPVEEGLPYLIEAPVYASSVAAGNKLRIGVSWYDDTQASISTVFAHDAVLNAINTWETHGGILTAPANARYAKPLVSKVNTAFTARLDRMTFDEVPIAFDANLSATHAVSGSYNVIQFDQVDGTNGTYDHGGNFDTGNYWFLVPADGVYSFSAGGYILAPNAGASATLAIYVNAIRKVQGRQLVLTTNANESYMSVNSGPMFLSRDDQITVRMSSSAAETVGASFNGTFFRGARVE